MTAPLLPPGVKVLTVSELTRDVKTLLEEAPERIEELRERMLSLADYRDAGRVAQNASGT